VPGFNVNGGSAPFFHARFCAAEPNQDRHLTSSTDRAWGPKFRSFGSEPSEVTNSRFRFHNTRTLPSDARFPGSHHGGYLHPIATFCPAPARICWLQRDVEFACKKSIISDPVPPPVKLHNRCPAREWSGRDLVRPAMSTAPAQHHGQPGDTERPAASLHPARLLRVETGTANPAYIHRQGGPPLPTHRTPR
jgi:hypothetical protein